jgi:uncharacterized protein (DUF2249 family)
MSAPRAMLALPYSRAPVMISLNPVQQVYPFDARGIGRRFRHAAIFGALDALSPGETMRFVNDHEPLPLLAQLRERYGDGLLVEARQREPGAFVMDLTMLERGGEDGDESCGCCGSCG